MDGSASEALPAFTPDAAGLAHTELLLNGAYRLSGFMTAKEAAGVRDSGRLPDGRPWPVPVVLAVSEEHRAAEELLLTDPEGAPVATLEVAERWQEDGRHHLSGAVHGVRPPAHGVLRRRRMSPEQAATGRLRPARPLLVVVADRALHWEALAKIHGAADSLTARHGTRHPPEILVLVDTPFTDARPWRAVEAALPHLPQDALRLAAVTLPDPALARPVAEGYGADAVVLATSPHPDLPEEDLHARLRRGEALPEWFGPPEVAAELARLHPPRPRRGLVVFFTGLSGSGKSTVARGVTDRVLESGREVTLLDGDVVRRLLSKGLTFSKEDRDANIRRIGYVAAEVARHGGVAVCAPIAPYSATRAEVRTMVEHYADFVLVHVATPLEVCEARDRKGLYAQARAGQIPEFTGISDPYEVPEDAEVVLDTSSGSIEEAVAAVEGHLRSGGWLG